MKKPTFTAQGDASADIVIVGSGVVGGLMANELVSQG
jgi:fructose 5-dehydrogenase large subunit